MTDEEIMVARAKATAEVLIGNMYLRFTRTYRHIPQLIRVSETIMKTLVPTAERRPVTYFGVDVILDESLPTAGCECQWKN
jgi:hypothetical protein